MNLEVRYEIRYIFEDYLQQLSMRVSWDTLNKSIQQSLLDKLTGPQLVKKFLAFYGTRNITTFTRVLYLSQP